MEYDDIIKQIDPSIPKKGKYPRRHINYLLKLGFLMDKENYMKNY